ncbi:MAG: transketolase [Deltaproteobacteria bacterium]|nr:transketolase [Deltaproteobacteria bacterium]
MPLIDSKSMKTIKDLSVDELVREARLMRGRTLAALCCAGSGHSGGSLSAMDIAAALYLHEARIDPADPDWPERDRIVWSAGHKAPALFACLHAIGALTFDELATLRKYGSRLQGHPDWRKTRQAEVSTGSLGQGLSIAVGMAIAARIDRRTSRVFAILGDGELQEGQIWEAVMAASHHKASNMVAIVDHNRIQLDGFVRDIMEVEPIGAKFEAFGWRVLACRGHDMADVVRVLAEARNADCRPTCIVAATTKGKGVSFMENDPGWHGIAPSREQLVKALDELGIKAEVPWERMLETAAAFQRARTEEVRARRPKFSRDYSWNNAPDVEVKMDATRQGFGQALEEVGGDPRIVCIGADLSGSVTLSQFHKKHAERAERYVSVGIAEQNGTAIAAGFARDGKKPVFGSFAMFAAGRNLDQLRNSVAYGRFDVLIAASHSGLTVGPDGGSHQALEDLFAAAGIPGMTVVAPADRLETARATKALLLDREGPKYLRFAREKTPMITGDATPFEIGRANVIRLVDASAGVKGGFETRLSGDGPATREDVAFVACGPMVAEAMRAALILEKEFGKKARVVNMHTIKPMDEAAVIDAAKSAQCLVTVEDHQKGGLGFRVAAILARARLALPFDMIGVNDEFGTSGEPWELLDAYGLLAEHIAKRAKELLG